MRAPEGRGEVRIKWPCVHVDSNIKIFYYEFYIIQKELRNDYSFLLLNTFILFLETVKAYDHLTPQKVQSNVMRKRHSL